MWIESPHGCRQFGGAAELVEDPVEECERLPRLRARLPERRLQREVPRTLPMYLTRRRLQAEPLAERPDDAHVERDQVVREADPDQEVTRS